MTTVANAPADAPTVLQARAVAASAATRAASAASRTPDAGRPPAPEEIPAGEGGHGQAGGQHERTRDWTCIGEAGRRHDREPRERNPHGHDRERAEAHPLPGGPLRGVVLAPRILQEGQPALGLHTRQASLPVVPRARMPEPTETAAARSVVRVRVRFCETDLMGIVHHGSYVVYMEAARVEWLRRRGVSYASWAERGQHLAVVDLTLKYRAPARFDDELDVEVRLGETGAASVRFDYRLVRATDGLLCAEGSTRLACVDATQTLRRISPDMADVLSRAEGA